MTADRLIAALDVASADEARSLVACLGPRVGFYKVGLQTLTAAGPALVRELVASRKKVFLDLKLHEIPTSVAGAVHAAGELGVAMVTVHASGGEAVLRAAVSAAREHPGLQVLALTVITSLRDEDLPAIGLAASVEDQVLRLARLADSCGCDGVVASAHEAALLRGTLRAGMLIVVPGVQPESLGNDQARAATPRQALANGATHLVVGRALAKAADPAAVAERIRADIAAAWGTPG
jgi:orotidine-5'-phosphate decarboxylase